MENLLWKFKVIEVIKMGTCCGAHLQTKIRDYARNAQNGAVTVAIVENPQIIRLREEDGTKEGKLLTESGGCDYCKAPAEFNVSYYPK